MFQSHVLNTHEPLFKEINLEILSSAPFKYTLLIPEAQQHFSSQVEDTIVDSTQVKSGSNTGLL